MEKNGKPVWESGKISRKDFLQDCLACSMGIALFNTLTPSDKLFAGNKIQLKEAQFWKSLRGEKTKCLLCPNGCVRSPGNNGKCRSRGNRNGTFYSLTYARPCVIALDYIEKSPLYHYQVKGKVFSIATAGCNLGCQYCQNWQYSQVGPDEVEETFHLEPAEVIRRAKKHNVNAINFFYTEPTVYFEYMLDIAALAKKENMKTFCITAGFINPKPLKKLIPYIDAFAVGLKGFNNRFYTKYIKGKMEPVQETLKLLAKNRDKTWFEIVNLLVPGLNDSKRSISAMTRWIKKDIGTDVPIHFTRFEPNYKLKNLPPTPAKTLEQAYAIAKKNGLKYVYLGNLPGHDAGSTYCPKCGTKVIERFNFKVIESKLNNGKCPCGYTLPGHWE
ncbi:MAG: AmmeMemoRadiSam system radical SAM enzyme [bacterium]|nr:AmmeMemoRadiSam system radical SAM enzyme [bacterium]